MMNGFDRLPSEFSLPPTQPDQYFDNDLQMDGQGASSLKLAEDVDEDVATVVDEVEDFEFPLSQVSISSFIGAKLMDEPVTRGLSTNSNLAEALYQMCSGLSRGNSLVKQENESSILSRKRSLDAHDLLLPPSKQLLLQPNCFLNFPSRSYVPAGCDIPAPVLLSFSSVMDSSNTQFLKHDPQEFRPRAARAARELVNSEDDWPAISAIQDIEDGNDTIHPALLMQKEFYRLPRLCNLDQRLSSRGRFMPAMKHLMKIFKGIDYVHQDVMQQLCDESSPRHCQLLAVIQSTRLRWCQSRRVVKNWMQDIYVVVSPHNIKDHKAERLTRQAISLLVAVIMLIQHQGRGGMSSAGPAGLDFEAASFALAMEKFLASNQEFINSPRQKVLKSALLRVFVFFTELFTMMSLKGNLEVCLLLASFLEGDGKHHQRGGGNADVYYKFYREFLEYIDNQVMPMRRQMIVDSATEEKVSKTL